MTDEIINPGDISLSNREILFQYWEEFYSQAKTPGEFFHYLNEKNPEIYMDFSGIPESDFTKKQLFYKAVYT